MQVAGGDDPVGSGQRVGVGEVLLELAVGVLVVVGVVAPAQGVHRRGDLGEVVVHAGQAAGVVAGLRGGRRAASAGASRPFGVAADQEVLHLGADVEVQVGPPQLPP